MRGINIGGGLTECKAFKHFGEELIIIIMSKRIRPKILGGLQPPLPMPMLFNNCASIVIAEPPNQGYNIF